MRRIILSLGVVLLGYLAARLALGDTVVRLGHLALAQVVDEAAVAAPRHLLLLLGVPRVHVNAAHEADVHSEAAVAA